MLKTSLVVIVIVLLVVTGVWLNMQFGASDIPVTSENVASAPRVIGFDDVGLQPENDSLLAAGATPQTPAAVEYGELLVVVRDAGAFPLSDVRITLQSGSDEDEVQRGVTGPTGEAAFGSIPAGPYNYELEAPNRPTLVSARPVLLSPGEYRVLELQLDDHVLSIQGRVVDTNGAPVADIEITAQAHGAADQPRLNRAAGPAIVTDANGAFEVNELASGEYTIQTRKTDRYASAKAIVQAGSFSAMLMVAEQRVVRISGAVRDDRNLPVTGVRVQPLGQAGADTNTDPGGHYEVTLRIDDQQRRYYLRFRDDRYREALISVMHEDWKDADVVMRDITLEPLGEVVAVSGRLMDTQGNPVAGEQVHLASRDENVQYQTQSDQLGSFTFAATVAGDDYRFWVRPRGNYNDYTRDSITIATVPVQLDVVLDALSTGTVTGQVIDRQGIPVSNVGLLLYSALASSRAIDVTSDAHGAFTAQDVPAGMLTFKTRSSPRLHLRDIELIAGEEKYVEIVLDKGWETLRGNLFDAAGQPVGGAQVRLYDDDTSSSSRTQHSTVTDEFGVFTFNALGSGPYRLDITAPGFRRFTKSLEAGEDFLEVRLEPSAN